MINKVILLGHVGRDPEVRYVGASGSSDSKVAQFSLATTERYTDRNGQKQEQTEWHNIVCWRGLAQLAEKYIRKGTQLYIEGKIQSRSWEDDKGNRRYATDIVAQTIQMLGSKPDGAVEGAKELERKKAQEATRAGSVARPARTEPLPPAGDPVDDDLPF